MRYEHGFGVTIPWVDTKEDGSTVWQHSLVHTNSAVNHRRVKRILRRWVKNTMGRMLNNYELRLLMRKVQVHKQPMFYMRQK